MRERASGGEAAIFHRGRIPRGIREWNSTRLFTNPLMASPLAFTASQPKQMDSRVKSRQLRRLLVKDLSSWVLTNALKVKRWVWGHFFLSLKFALPVWLKSLRKERAERNRTTFKIIQRTQTIEVDERAHQEDFIIQLGYVFDLSKNR